MPAKVDKRKRGASTVAGDAGAWRLLFDLMGCDPGTLVEGASSLKELRLLKVWRNC